MLPALLCFSKKETFLLIFLIIKIIRLYSIYLSLVGKKIFHLIQHNFTLFSFLCCFFLSPSLMKKRYSWPSVFSKRNLPPIQNKLTLFTYATNWEKCAPRPDYCTTQFEFLLNTVFGYQYAMIQNLKIISSIKKNSYVN